MGQKRPIATSEGGSTLSEMQSSRFHGIRIRMDTFNAQGVARFHAKYGQSEALYAAGSLRRLGGELPTLQKKLVLAWAVIHRERLLDNGRRLARGLRPHKIPGIR
jgi:hypothetical protein